MANKPTTALAPSLEYERAFWRDGYARVAGLDEVGRGALAGPVVAAAVILPRLTDAADWQNDELYHAIARANDSKRLSAKLRDALYEPLCALAVGYAPGAATHLEIDRLNIARASRLAMARALAALPFAPDALLLDALVLAETDLPQVGIIHGDALALSIAAASILAKVTRDRLMVALDAEYPGYGFAENKGYGTRAHLAALERLGPSPVHRHSFAPVRMAQAPL